MSYTELEAVVDAAQRLEGLRRVASVGGEHDASLADAETAVEKAAMSRAHRDALRQKVEGVADEARRRGLDA